MNGCLTRYYRCPERYSPLASRDILPVTNGYFLFGPEATCYGHYRGKKTSQNPSGVLHDALQDVVIEKGTTYLPFDPSQVVGNLYREVYVGDWRHGSSKI